MYCYKQLVRNDVVKAVARIKGFYYPVLKIIFSKRFVIIEDVTSSGKSTLGYQLCLGANIREFPGEHWLAGDFWYIDCAIAHKKTLI